jgi:hypothetical protein
MSFKKKSGKEARMTYPKHRVDLIEKALNELPNKQCPNCQADIRTSGYISREDIQKWLEKEEQCPTKM